MIYIVINSAAILAATLAGLLVGFVYLRVAGLAWRRPATALAALIAEFWLAAILAGALILAPAKADPWTMAIGSAVVIWIGFVVPTTVVTQSARQARTGAIALDCLHWLVVMVIQALVLKSIGLIPPPA